MKAFYDATVELGVDSRVTTFTLSDFGRTLQPSGVRRRLGRLGSRLGQPPVRDRRRRDGRRLLRRRRARTAPCSRRSPSAGRTTPTRAAAGSRRASVEQYAATLASWFGVAPADIPTVFPLIGRFTTPNLGFLP